MSKRHRAIFLIGLLFSPGWALAQTKNQESLLSGELITKNTSDTLLIALHQNLIIVEASVLNVKRKFLLDTGAPTVISAGLQNEIKADTIFTIELSDIHEVSRSTAFVSLKLVSLGKLQFQEIPAGVMDAQNPFFECLGIDGIIGSNLLHHTAIRIDSRANQIIIADKVETTPTQKPVALNLDQQKSPYLKINPGPRTSEELLFDTGFTGLYSLCNRNYKFFTNRNRLKKVELSKGIGSSTLGLYGTGNNPDTTYLLRLRFLKVNETKLSRPIITTSPDRNSKLGAELFQYGVITLDYTQKRFWFEPYTNQMPITESYWGFEPSVASGYLIVGRVWQNSNAQQAGLMAGQRILMVNKMRLSAASFCDASDELKDLADKGELTLEVEEADGRVKTISIKKELVK
ncbi:MAG: aspartyl protease family protein [Cyclobacteriaceae bacterium]|nr:aspartyl protease family protein [Cyclobacteriaceae bacterium]